MTKCILCGAKQVHKQNCPSSNVFVSEIENIDLMLKTEVNNMIKKCEMEYKKYGHISSNGHQ